MPSGGVSPGGWNGVLDVYTEGVIIIEISRVKDGCQPDLTRIVHALGSLRPLFGFRQGRQQHGCENGDNRYYHEQLYQSERASRAE